MLFSEYQNLVKTNPSNLRQRFVYSPTSMPSYGVGLRFLLDEGVLTFEILHLMSQDGSKPCGDSNDVNVLSNVHDIPLEVRELACLLERKLEAWRDGSISSLDLKSIGYNIKVWEFLA